MERLLTIDDVAEMLQVKKSTVYSLVQRRFIPFIKLSRKLLRFRESEIREWIETGKVSPVTVSQKPEKARLKKKAQIQDDYLDRIIQKAKEDAFHESGKFSWTLVLSYFRYVVACKSLIRKGGM